jgi:RNA polymerase sigma-70 factor (ECF subfamily)
MYGIAMRYFKSPDECQDAVQEGFIKLFSKIRMFDYSGSFEGWMRRMFVNTYIDIIRKNKIEPEFDENLMEHNITEYDNIEEHTAEFSLEEIIEVLQALPPSYRTVFNLFYIEGYSHQEIAQILNVTEGTSKSNLFKAREKMKAGLEELRNKKMK